MGKAVNTDVLDAALGVVRTATRMVALAAQPADYATANSAKLAEVVLAPADFSAFQTGTVDGRKTSVALKSGVSVIAAGTATHVALTDPGTSRLLYVTTCPSQALVGGATVNFAPWEIEFGNPV